MQYPLGQMAVTRTWLYLEATSASARVLVSTLQLTNFFIELGCSPNPRGHCGFEVVVWVKEVLSTLTPTTTGLLHQSPQSSQ
jgi:hypothetical protein